MKKWFAVRYKIQVWETRHYFLTEDELVEKLQNPDYRSREKEDTSILELKLNGKSTYRKDLLKKINW